MAGLEVVVRPVVFPDIRPAPPQSLPPADDPEKGFAVIRGNGAKQIDLTNSYSASVSTSAQKEIKRRVDVARVYQKTADGKVNKENFVDLEVANKIWMKGGSEPAPNTNAGDTTFDVPDFPPGVTRGNVAVQNYQPIKEGDNIEVTKRNVIKQSDQ